MILEGYYHRGHSFHHVVKLIVPRLIVMELVPQNPLNKQTLMGISLLLVTIWIVFFIDRILPLEQLALRPRTLGGLVGIVAMPFLHLNLGHIISNSAPLVILTLLLTLQRKNAFVIVISIALLGGVLLWCFGRSASHIGASGLVFGLAAYLLAGGYKPESMLSFVLALVTLFLYGGSLFLGLVPTNSGVSWDGHLTGAVAGVLVAKVGRNLLSRERSTY